MGQLVRLAPVAMQQTPAVHLPHIAAVAPALPSEDFKKQLEILNTARGVMAAIGATLAPRALLFVAMIGALGLTIPAMIAADFAHLLAAVSFDVLIFWPTAYLYWKDEHA